MGLWTIRGLIVGLIGLVVLYDIAVVAQEAATTPGSAQMPAQVAPAPEVKKETAEQKALKVWKNKLDGSVWELTLTPMDGKKKAKVMKDTITFDGKKVSSKWLTKEGYSNSNFSLRMQDKDTAIWETMQTKGNGEAMAFWRGEVRGEEMRGILSQRLGGDKSKNFSISGTLSGRKQAEDTGAEGNT